MTIESRSFDAPAYSLPSPDISAAAPRLQTKYYAYDHRSSSFHFRCVEISSVDGNQLQFVLQFLLLLLYSFVL